MRSITSLASRLQADFPQFAFVASDGFRWSPKMQTVFYDEASGDQAALLHELAHALLGHEGYTRDVALLELERDAWAHAQEVLAGTYDIIIDADQTEDALDTYRDWLHARSLCPGCHATGIQVKQNEYKCIVCMTRWRVNDARACALRRYKVA